jgi:hypothetical protein
MVRDDCARRLDELDKAQPTIVFEVKDASGRDVTDVKVTMDGKALTERLNGRPVPVDVGEHFFTFEVDVQPPVTLTRTLVLAEGEKGRRERIVLGRARASAPAPVPPLTHSSPESVGPSPVGPEPPNAPSASTEPRPPHPPRRSRPPPTDDEPPTGGESPTDHAHAASSSNGQKTWAVVLGGVGVVGVAVGSVSGLLSMSKVSLLKGECLAGGHCTTGHGLSDYNAMSTLATISDVGFMVGVVGLAVGTVLLLTSGGNAPAHDGSTTPGRLWIGLTGAGVEGMFQ